MQSPDRSPSSSKLCRRPLGVRRAAVDFATTVARQGLNLTSLPTIALPGRLRRKVFASARLASRAGARLPRPVAVLLEGFADDLESLEASLSGREDLGTRRRREQRKRRRRRSRGRC